MVNFKRLGKRLTAAVLCCVLIALMVAPVSAISYSSVTHTNAVIPVAPELTLENPAVVQGQRACSVRRSASANSIVIGSFADGTKVTVLGTRGNFYKVDCYDMVGYIHKSQLTVNEAGEYYVNCTEDSSETTYLPTYTMQESLELRSSIRSIAYTYIGVPYVHGGSSARGFDCSGLTQYVYMKAGISIHRSCATQLSDGMIVAKEDLQCGDLVFFSNTGDTGGFASHVGIYIGNNQIIHASSSRGVIVADLSNSYFESHYQCARRVILSELTPAASIPTMGILQSGNASYWRGETENSVLGIH